MIIHVIHLPDMTWWAIFTFGLKAISALAAASLIIYGPLYLTAALIAWKTR